MNAEAFVCGLFIRSPDRRSVTPLLARRGDCRQRLGDLD